MLSQSSESYTREIHRGQRFAFGKNWMRFLALVNDERIGQAEESLRHMLRVDSLSGKTFLDIGSGSGLFSLAACRLGASVHSFDYDPQSVVCTRELKSRYFPDHSDWTIEEGSVLDREYLNNLGVFDIVYAWGVLHHTGNMWLALTNVVNLVKPGGLLYVALYNDQGGRSRRWRKVKQIYCSGWIGRAAMIAIFVPYFAFLDLVGFLLKFLNPAVREQGTKKPRGMARITNWLDWLGGYPFEVAKPEQIFDFFRD